MTSMPVDLDDTRSIGALLTDQSAALGERAFVVLPDDGLTLTYADVESRARRLAWGLRGLGLSTGDRVAVALPNGEQAIVGWFACLLAGLVDTAVSPGLSGEPLRYALEKTGCAAVLTDAEHLADIVGAGASVDSAALQVVCSSLPDDATAFEHVRLHDWADVVETAQECELRAAPYDGLASIRFTSGSTGMPKGIMMSPSHMRASAQMFAHLTGYRDGETVYTPFPLHHVLASITGVLAALEAGGTVSLARKFSARRFWPQVRDCGATVAQVLDPVVSILEKAEPSPQDTEHSVRCLYTAAGPFPDFEKRFGVQLVRLFDMSELTAIAHYRPGEEQRAGSCGRESELFTVAIADEDDRLVAPGTVGEIVVRPKVPGVMLLGYYGDADKTVEQWQNLWFHTGDMGRLDEDGFLYFTGRSADRIRHRGVNVSPEQIEAAACEHPDVAECAAIGVASDVSEDDIKLCLRLVEGSSISAEELGAQLAESMPDHLKPRYVQLYAQLPRTETEKIRKGQLRAEGADGLTEQTWDVSTGRWVSDLT